MLNDVELCWHVMHSASFILHLKLCHDHMVRPYRYIKHHILPEEGYNAASYPLRYEGRSHICICVICTHEVYVERDIAMLPLRFSSLRCGN
jgi:hypothetical protein